MPQRWWLRPELWTNPGQWARAEVRRKLVRIGALAVGVFAMIGAVAVLIIVITAPAAAPVIVAGTVLGSAAEAFSGGDGEMIGEELAAAGADSGVICDAIPAADPVTDMTPAAAAAVQPESVEDPAGEDAAPVPPEPIWIGEGGSISREDVEALLEPLTPGTSTLRAHVWFLYRLAGMGDWAAFTTAYENAGLSPAEEYPDAPLRQVQTLNANGVPVERYRLTAAAMAEAGQKTGRFTDPYPGYEELLVVEVLSSCLSDTDAGESRMTLPAPSTTTVAPAPAEVPEPVPAEPVTAGS
jgi:hypothetical protein